MNLSRFPKTNLLKFIHRSNQTALDLFFLSGVSVGKNAGFSYLMDVYGRLRVREYNTLHRAIRKSSWGPVRCNIALHLRMETVMGYSPSNLNAVSIPGHFPQVCRRKKDDALSSTHFPVSFIYHLKLRTTVKS